MISGVLAEVHRHDDCRRAARDAADRSAGEEEAEADGGALERAGGARDHARHSLESRPEQVDRRDEQDGLAPATEGRRRTHSLVQAGREMAASRPADRVCHHRNQRATEQRTCGQEKGTALPPSVHVPPPAPRQREGTAGGQTARGGRAAEGRAAKRPAGGSAAQAARRGKRWTRKRPRRCRSLRRPRSRGRHASPAPLGSCCRDGNHT